MIPIASPRRHRHRRRHRQHLINLAVLLLLAAPAARAQVTVAIDPTADLHAIAPLIYGINFASAAQAGGARIPLTRWGGNSTSRYNYQIDVTNTGSDY